MPWLEGAAESLEFLTDLRKRKIVKIRNAAVLTKDKDGKTAYKESDDVDAKGLGGDVVVTDGHPRPSNPGAQEI